MKLSLSQSIKPSLFVGPSIVLVLLFSTSLWFQDIRPISPAILVYAPQDALFPILLSPFITRSWISVIAQLLQLSWIIFFTPRASLEYLTGIYATLLIMRSALGYILTRSVGWAYPRLFCHSALYEPIYGFGPLLAGALLQNDIDGVRWSANKRRTLVRLAVLGAFAFTDQLPWSYMCGAAVGGVYRLLQSFGLFRLKSGEASEDGAGLATSEGGYMLLPWPISSSHARRSDVPQSQSYPHISPGRIVLLTILTMLTTGFAGTIPSSNVFSAIYSSPHTTQFPSNLRLHVVMLTIPRLKDLGSDILISSVSSYIDPWQSSSSKHSRGEDTGLEFTVFAHLAVDGTHPGFNRARSHFQSLYPDTSPSPFPLNFYVQEPPVPRPANVEAARAFGVQHHLDFADAVQYAFDKGAEWTMFVEDDFVLCGSWGLEGLLSVMAELEQERQGSGKVNGAFIGTGGSGLIFHRSLLPVLKEMLLLIAHLTLSAAEPSSGRIPSPPELYHPSIPPDVLSQACLTGSLSVCPSASSSSSPLTLLDALNPWYPTKESGWVISSRLLMGHRGGAYYVSPAALMIGMDNLEDQSNLLVCGHNFIYISPISVLLYCYCSRGFMSAPNIKKLTTLKRPH